MQYNTALQGNETGKAAFKTSSYFYNPIQGPIPELEENTQTQEMDNLRDTPMSQRLDGDDRQTSLKNSEVEKLENKNVFVSNFSNEEQTSKVSKVPYHSGEVNQQGYWYGEAASGGGIDEVKQDSIYEDKEESGVFGSEGGVNVGLAESASSVQLTEQKQSQQYFLADSSSKYKMNQEQNQQSYEQQLESEQYKQQFKLNSSNNNNNQAVTLMKMSNQLPESTLQFQQINSQQHPSPQTPQIAQQQSQLLASEIEDALVGDCKSGNVSSGLQKLDYYLHRGFRELDSTTFGKIFMKIIKRLSNLSVDYLNQGDTQSAIFMLTKCDEWTQNSVFGYFPQLRALILNHFGCAFRRQNQFKKAMIFCEQALQILLNSNERNYRGLTYLNLSALSSQQGDHKKGLDLARMALLESQHEFMEELKNRKNLTNNRLSTNANDDNQDTLDYQNKAHTLIISYHNIAAEEEYSGNYEEALLYYEYSIKAADEYLGQNSRISEHFKQQFAKFTSRYANFKIEGQRRVVPSDVFIVHSDQFCANVSTKRKSLLGNKKRILKKNNERSNTSDRQVDFTGFTSTQDEEIQVHRRSNSNHNRLLSSKRPSSAALNVQSSYDVSQQKSNFSTLRISSPKKDLQNQELKCCYVEKNQNVKQSQPFREQQQLRIVKILQKKSLTKKVSQHNDNQQKQYSHNPSGFQQSNSNSSIDFAQLFPSKAHSLYSPLQFSQRVAQFQSFTGGASSSSSSAQKTFTLGGNDKIGSQTTDILLFNHSSPGEKQNKYTKRIISFYHQQPVPSSESTNVRAQTPQGNYPKSQGIGLFHRNITDHNNKNELKIISNSNSTRGISRIQLLESLKEQYYKATNNLQSLELKIQEEITKKNNFMNIPSKQRFDTEQDQDIGLSEAAATTFPKTTIPIRPSHKKANSISSSSSKSMFAGSFSNSSTTTARPMSLSQFTPGNQDKRNILPESQLFYRNPNGFASPTTNTSYNNFLTRRTTKNNYKSFSDNGNIIASSLQTSQPTTMQGNTVHRLQQQNGLSNLSVPGNSINSLNKESAANSRQQYDSFNNNQIQQQKQQLQPQNAQFAYQHLSSPQSPINQMILVKTPSNNDLEILVNIPKTQLSCLGDYQGKLLFEGRLQFILNRVKLQLQIVFTSEQFVGQLEHYVNVSDLFIFHQTDDFAMVELLVAFSDAIQKQLFVNISLNCLSVFFVDSKQISIGNVQILLDRVLLKLDLKQLKMKQDVEIVIKNSNESILLLCEESAPLQDSHRNDGDDDGAFEGEETIKPLVNTGLINGLKNNLQERNYRRNKQNSVSGKRSVGEEVILEVVEEADTFSQVKNNPTQSQGNVENAMPNNKISLMASNQTTIDSNEPAKLFRTEEGSKNLEEKQDDSYHSDIFEEIPDVGENGEGNYDNFEEKCELALVEGEIKKNNNSRPKSSYKNRSQNKNRETQDKNIPNTSQQISKAEEKKNNNKLEDGKGSGDRCRVNVDSEDNSTPVSKYGFQTRDFVKRKLQQTAAASTSSKNLLDIESQFELPHDDDARFENDNKPMSTFGGFGEEEDGMPGFQNSKQEHAFDDSANQSIQQLVADTVEGQSNEAISSPNILHEEEQLLRRVTPPPKILINNGLGNEDLNAVQDNRQQDNVNSANQEDNQEISQKENQELVVLEGPIEEYEKVASLIGAAFRNRKRKQKEQKGKEGKETAADLSSNINNEGIGTNIEVKEQNNKEQEDCSKVKKTQKAQDNQPVVLEGPIEEYEKVANKIGAAFKLKKKRQADKEAVKQENQQQTKTEQDSRQLDQNDISELDKRSSNSEVPADLRLLSPSAQRNQKEQFSGNEPKKDLSGEQEQMFTQESGNNDTDRKLPAKNEQMVIPIVKKKSQVQGKFKMSRRFHQQVGFII